MTAHDACVTCTRLTGSVRRTDLLAHRGAAKALVQGQLTPFARAMQAHEEAVRRLQTHVTLDHPPQAAEAPVQAASGGRAGR